MKKEYVNPIIEIISLTEEDIITTSSNSFGGDWAGDNNTGVDKIL